MGKLTEEQKRKLRKILGEGTKPAVSAALAGHPVSDETRQKLSKALKGRKKSAEWIRKISEAHRGRLCFQFHTPEAKAKADAARRAYQASLTHEERSERAKRGAQTLKRRGYKQPPLSAEKRAAAAERSRLQAQRQTPEQRAAKSAKIAEANRKRKQSPETREKLSQIARERHQMRKEWEAKGTGPQGSGFVPFALFNQKRKKRVKPPTQANT